MIFSLKTIAIAAAISTVFVIASHQFGKYQGMVVCEQKHKTAQLEKTIEVIKIYETIDRKVPYSADRIAKFKWLRENSSK